MDEDVRKILHEMRGVVSNLTAFVASGRRIVALEGRLDSDEIKDLGLSCDILERSSTRATTLLKKLSDILLYGVYRNC